MKLSRGCAHVVLVSLFLCGTAANAGQSSNELSKIEAQVREYLGKGLLDKAVVLLEEGAQRAAAAGQKEAAAEMLINASNLYREENRRDRAMEVLVQAAAVGRGTSLEIAATAFGALDIIQTQIDAGNIETALEGLGEIYTEKLPLVSQEDTRRSIQSSTLWLRQDIQHRFARVLDPSGRQSAATIDASGRRVLEVLLSDDPGKRPKSVLGSASWLDQQRPWRESMFEAALKTNGRIIEVERGMHNERIREIGLAQDLSERGTILGELDRVDEAIQLKKAALEVFHKYNVFRDSAVVADNLCGLLLKKGDDESLVSAFSFSRLVIGLVESQTFVQVAQTVDPFLQEYRGAYERHALLSWTRYQAQLAVQKGEADEGLGDFLIHADRFNFRAVRRDMAVYHDLGESISGDPETRAKLDRSVQEVLQAERTKDPTTQEVARRDFVTALEDIKRKETRTIGLDPTITAFMKNVVAGLSENDAVLMYFTPPGEHMHAALLEAQGIRIYPLRVTGAERLRDLISKLEREIVTTPQPILDQLSAILLAPLPQLPTRLTVVLTPDTLGIPFEALKTADGRLLIESHEVRYAFGLYRNVGMRSPPNPVRRAVVVGAETYDDGTVESLPQSRKEIEGIRALLGRLRVEVEPLEGLPKTGAGLVEDKSTYQVIHISTHSHLDKATPILDSLLFPTDRVYGYQFALAPVRSSLVVLSACALYQRRSDRLYPISGLTTAALSRIAPQVLSPIWEVNANATYIFMLRFYSALGESGDAVAALAQTKRDFISGTGLRQWLSSSGIGNIGDEEISEYRHAYYWAPFVLTTGVPSS